MRILDKFLPERQPSFPQTEILDRMYERMFQAYRLEQAQGVFMEHLRINGEGYDATIHSYAEYRKAVQAMSQRQFNGDGNFERLLRVSRKILLTVGEDDRYYRAWLGMLILLAHDEYEDWLESLTPQQLKFWCRAQWYVAPDCLSDEAVLEVKERLAPDVLAYYLHILASKRYNHLKNELEVCK